MQVSAAFSTLSTRRSARESRARPWLTNSVLARKSASHCGLSGAYQVTVDNALSTDHAVSPDSGCNTPVPQLASQLRPPEVGESSLAEKASVAAVASSGCFSSLRARANSLARFPSRIPRLRARNVKGGVATTPSHAGTPLGGVAAGSLGLGGTSRVAGVARGRVSPSSWCHRAVAAVSCSERKLKNKTLASVHTAPSSVKPTPSARPQPPLAAIRAGVSRARRALAHSASPSRCLAKASLALGFGATSGSKKPKKSILKVKDPCQIAKESCVRSFLGQVQAKQRPRVHFDAYPVTFACIVAGPDDYDRSSIACWSCDVNWEVEGEHDADCVSFDMDPHERSPSRAAWEKSQKQLRDEHDERLAVASGGFIRCKGGR